MIRPEYETFLGYWVAEAFAALREKLRQAQVRGEIASKVRYRLAR